MAQRHAGKVTNNTNDTFAILFPRRLVCKIPGEGAILCPIMTGLFQLQAARGSGLGITPLPRSESGLFSLSVTQMQIVDLLYLQNPSYRDGSLDSAKQVSCFFSMRANEK